MAHSHAEPSITEKKPARPKRVQNGFRFASHSLARTRALPALAVSVALPRERTSRCRAVSGQSSFSLYLSHSFSRSLGLRDRIENKRCHWPRQVYYRLTAVDAAVTVAVVFSRTHAREYRKRIEARGTLRTAGSARAAAATLRSRVPMQRRRSRR